MLTFFSASLPKSLRRQMFNSLEPKKPLSRVVATFSLFSQKLSRVSKRLASSDGDPKLLHRHKIFGIPLPRLAQISRSRLVFAQVHHLSNKLRIVASTKLMAHSVKCSLLSKILTWSSSLFPMPPKSNFTNKFLRQ